MTERPSNPATDSTLAAVPGAAPGRPGTLGPGTIVAETYQITRLLGQGGMGAVWEAKHLRLPDKRVVVKVLLFGTTDAVTLARFRREAEIASRLGHPNIVQVLDFNTLPDGAPFIVLELLQGESLAARLAHARPSFAETLAIVTQIGSALAAAHREGIVHRDLKPDNCIDAATGQSSSSCWVVEWGQWTYWALADRNNLVDMVIVPFDAAGNIAPGSTWPKTVTGARYIAGITVDDSNQTVTLVGQGSASTAPQWF